MTHVTARAKTLADLVQRNGWTYGAELGVYEGATSDHLLSTCPGLSMLGVDVWEPIPGGPKDKNTGFSPKAADVIAAAKVKAYEVQRRHGERFRIIERRTVVAGEGQHYNGRTPERYYDFVFVDASHVTADVVADVHAWYPLIRRGGMCLGHDANWPAIQAALATLGFLPRVQYFPGNVWGVDVL